MRKNSFGAWGVIMAVSLAVGLLSGCGGEYDTSFHGGTENVSGAAIHVTGQAVSGQAVDSQPVSGSPVSAREENTEQYRFCNKTHLYYCDYDEGDSFLVERSLEDSSERKIFIKNFEKVCYVDDNWVYYVKWEKADADDEKRYSYDQLWRAPIHEKEGERTLAEKEGERIFTEKSGIGDSTYDYSWQNFYCDGRYILYITTDNYTLKEYDLKKREYIKPSGRKSLGIASIGTIWGKTGIVSFSTNGEGMYRLDLDTGELGRITDSRVFEENVVGTEDDVFYQEGFDETYAVWQYHIEDGSKQKILVPEQLKEKLEEEQLMDFSKGKEHSYYVSEMFIRNNSLYYQVSLSWMEGETEYQDYAIFRVGLDKTDELIYEKGLSEVLKNPAENQKAFHKESWVPGGAPESENIIYRSRGGVVMMTEESAYCVLYNPQEGKNRLGCYDFDSGQMKYITKKDVEFEPMMCRYGDVLFAGGYQWGIFRFLPNNEELSL
ncbi:MAG: hypothetical protein NC293_03250 [Roseburia sp.]|nr:hypothetical protein [Roseburia sp.]